MTATLADLAAELAAVLAAAEDADGELSPELEARLDAASGAFAAKAEALWDWSRERLALAAASREKAKAALARAGRLERQAARVREWIRTQLSRAGERHIETETIRLTVCQNSRPSFTALEIDQVPEPFRVARTVVSLDDDRVLAYWREHKAAPPGVQAIIGWHLRET
jgi:hypothetical protein